MEAASAVVPWPRSGRRESTSVDVLDRLLVDALVSSVPSGVWQDLDVTGEDFHQGLDLRNAIWIVHRDFEIFVSSECRSEASGVFIIRSKVWCL